MLSLILIWNIFLLLSVGVGYSVFTILKVSILDRNGDQLIVSAWIGISLISSLMLGLSLVVPLSPVNSLIALALIAFGVHWIIGIKTWKKIINNFNSKITVVTLLLVQLGISNYVVKLVITDIDTGIYHFGAIHWLSKFGTVYGLSLLNVHFGIPSSWFALAAPLSSEQFGFRFVTFTGGLVMTLLVFHLILASSRCLSGQGKRWDWFSIFYYLLSLPFIIYISAAISPTPNFPLYVYPLIVGWSILILYERRKINRQSCSLIDLIPLLLAIGAFNIKLGAAPLVVVAGLYFLSNKNNQNLPHFTILVITTTICLSPSILASYKLSGCLAFPSKFGCFDVPWRVFSDFSQTIKDWARGSGSSVIGENPNWYFHWPRSNFFYASMLIYSILAIPILYCIHKRKRLVGITLISTLSIIVLALILSNSVNAFWQPNKYLLTANAVITFASVTLLFRKLRIVSLEYTPAYIWIVLISLVGNLFIMFAGPSIRFGLGFAVILPAMMLSFFGESIVMSIRDRIKTKSVTSRFYPFFLLTSIVAGVGLFTGGFIKSNTEKIHLPAAIQEGRFTAPKIDYFSPWLLPYKMLGFGGLAATIHDPEYKLYIRNGVTFFLSNQDNHCCWNQTLPCTQDYVTNVRYRHNDSSLASGFERIK